MSDALDQLHRRTMLLLIGFALVGIIVLIHPWEGPTNGVSGILVGYEHTNWPYRGTTITFATYSDVTSTLSIEGIHDFEVGHIYEVTYTHHAYHIRYTLIERIDKGSAFNQLDPQQEEDEA